MSSHQPPLLSVEDFEALRALRDQHGFLALRQQLQLRPREAHQLLDGFQPEPEPASRIKAFLDALRTTPAWPLAGPMLPAVRERLERHKLSGRPLVTPEQREQIEQDVARAQRAHEKRAARDLGRIERKVARKAGGQ